MKSLRPVGEYQQQVEVGQAFPPASAGHGPVPVEHAMSFDCSCGAGPCPAHLDMQEPVFGSRL
jgi:hypothetical protein